MDAQTTIWLILAALIAIGIAVFHYFYKSKERGSRTFILAFLRFLGIFGLLVLLINPKITDIRYTLVKPNLALLIDNSTSVGKDSLAIAPFLSALQQDEALQERFRVSTYAFGNEMRPLNVFNFKDRQTNIQQSLSILREVFSKEKTVIGLLSDGNQTIGADYVFSEIPDNFAVYPVAVGDTTSYEDLSVGQINTNTYAFLNNKFPVETFVVYKGKNEITQRLRISMNGETVHTERINLSAGKNLKTINTILDAKSIGVKTIRVTVDPLDGERNMENNAQETIVEVIDEKTNIGLVTGLAHPDIGALKKAIESNEQREVFILPPTAVEADLDEMDLFIVYQPTVAFKGIFEYIQKKGTHTLLITGAKTDYNFLNRAQQDFTVELGYPKQEILASLNNGFALFDITDLDLEGFPPLTSTIGPISFKRAHETLLGASIRGTAMEWPLMTLFAENENKRAVLFGEDIWKWRIQSFRNRGNFSNFDAFLGKVIRFLSVGSSRDRLNVTYDKRYLGSSAAVVKATYFDGAYVFDPNAQLTITVVDVSTKKEQSQPMVLRNGFFEADLTSLVPGNYVFTIKVAQENITKTGNFTIADFDMEKQFVSTDYKKLQQLAVKNRGQLYFLDTYDRMLTDLKTNDAYLPTRKGEENVVSLIDFKLVMAIIVMAFALEWFIRKYHGLI